jgi:signal transduction histidine kinase
MSAQKNPDRHTKAAQAAASQAAELSELLGHVNSCWDEERRTLARQLHDCVGSSLTALTMHLSMLARQLPADQALLDRTAQMKQLLLSVIDQNRQMQLKLWNDKLEFLGVCVALGELATQFGEQHQIVVRCSLPETEPVCPPVYGVALLRTLEEALNNIAAHAQASEVDIILDDNDEALVLTVKDDGIGLRPGYAAQAGTYGLRMLRERMRHLGGALTLAANGEHGTTLAATLPRNAAQ